MDLFHAHGHVSACRNSPLNVPALKDRLAEVNTSIAEQVWSWFRGYARTFNDMRPLRHIFIVLTYSRLHNDLVADGALDRLGPVFPARRSRGARPYGCTADAVHKKPSGSEAQATRKRPAASM